MMIEAKVAEEAHQLPPEITTIFLARNQWSHLQPHPTSSLFPAPSTRPAAGQPPNAKETIHTPIFETSKHCPSISAITSNSVEHQLDKQFVYPATVLPSPPCASRSHPLSSQHNTNFAQKIF